MLDVATGAIAWRAELGAAVNTSPAVTDSTIFVTTADNRLVALPAGECGAATCGPLWQASLGATLTGPTVGGDVVYVGTSAGDVKAFAAAGCGSATCGVLRTVHVGTSVASSPVVDGGRVLVMATTGAADPAGRLVALGLPAG